MKHNSLQDLSLNISIGDTDEVKMKPKSHLSSQFVSYLSASKAMKESGGLSESRILIEDLEQNSSSVESSEDTEDSAYRRY